MKYSLIIPVYNRPEEVDELLESLVAQQFADFEVLVVEDGSTLPCREVVEKYRGRLAVEYYFKPNSGPGQTRNYGAERSHGDYLIVLDSDCVLPPGYLQAVDDELRREPADAFGGPDRAHESFTDMQKAISYAMTSFFTTGMRFGEDIDFSIRIFKAGCSCRLFPEAWVWHKRRTDLKKFFKQVHNSGIARINLYKKYPESLKLVHLLPMVFTVGTTVLLLAALAGWIGSVWIFQMTHSYVYAVDMPGLMRHAAVLHALSWIPLLPLLLFALLIGVDAAVANRSLKIGLLAIAASFVQLIGYGTGFLRAWWQRCVRGKDEFAAFEKNFYK